MRIISGIARGTKLLTLEGDSTRPTLDRVKESLFSIIQHYIQGADVLDLFSGSGALALETLSRGAKRAILCDYSRKAISIIKHNVEKTKFSEQTEIWNLDYKKALDKCVLENYKFDIIFLDPPYGKGYITEAIENIMKNDILSENGIIVVETDEEKDVLEIKKLNFNIYDIRQYGRIKLIFIDKRGK